MKIHKPSAATLNKLLTVISGLLLVFIAVYFLSIDSRAGISIFAIIMLAVVFGFMAGKWNNNDN